MRLISDSDIIVRKVIHFSWNLFCTNNYKNFILFSYLTYRIIYIDTVHSQKDYFPTLFLPVLNHLSPIIDNFNGKIILTSPSFTNLFQGFFYRVVYFCHVDFVTTKCSRDQGCVCSYTIISYRPMSYSKNCYFHSFLLCSLALPLFDPLPEKLRMILNSLTE